MADDVFALSPISARAAMPSEQDYDAIREAFMETSRGRWFLGEYAKRNRNADTAMVLDAVARIEQAMAEQKREPERDDEELRAVLAAIRAAVEQAAEKASLVLTGLALPEKLAPIYKGTRIIKEISWRWREIGADSRICDLIDSQLAAIEASCGVIAEADGGAELSAAFNVIRGRLDELAGRADTPASDDGPLAAPAEPTSGQAATSRPSPLPEVPERDVAESMSDMHDNPVEHAVASHADDEPIAVEPGDIRVDGDPANTGDNELAWQSTDSGLEPGELVSTEHITQEPADELAEDEAVLELVAVEMAAVDDMPDPLPPEAAVAYPDSAAAFEAQFDPRTPEQPAAPTEVAAIPSPSQSAAAQEVIERPRPVMPEPSLGSSLLARGILPRSKPSDPLAPIRRMTQAEKIAFFS